MPFLSSKARSNAPAASSSLYSDCLEHQVAAYQQPSNGSTDRDCVHDSTEQTKVTATTAPTVGAKPPKDASDSQAQAAAALSRSDEPEVLVTHTALD